MSNPKEQIVYLERKSKRSPYDPRLILKVVKSIESGIPRRAIAEEYGVTPNSLTKWLKDHGSAQYKSQMKKSYSSSEKRSVVRAVEGGMSLKEAEISFDLSATTIRRWLIMFKEENTEISVSNPTDMPKKKTEPSAAEIKALQKALSEANLKIKALDTLIDIAEEQLKIDIRKKSGARQSPK